MPQVSGRFGPYPVSTILDGSGNGQVEFQAVGANIRITNGFAICSTSVKQARATAYKNFVAAGGSVSSTESGSTGAPFTGPFDLCDGERLIVRWEGGDAGATATATFTGRVIPFDQIEGSTITWNSFFAAGDGTIVFPALKSPNYVAGTSGWYLGRDGSIDVGSGTFRGTVIVTSPDGSSVKIIAGNGGKIEFYPATAVGETVDTPGFIVARSSAFGAGRYAYAVVDSPAIEYNGSGPVAAAQLFLSGAVSDGTPFANYATARPLQEFSGDGLYHGALHVEDIVKVGPDLGDIGRGRIAYAGDVANSGAVGNALTTVLTTNIATFRANRAYEIRVAGRFAPNAVNMSPGAVAVSSVGTTLYTYGRLSTPLVAEYANPNPEAVFTLGGADLVRSVSLQLISNTAGQTVSHQARRWISVFDIGPASDWPDAAVMV